MKSILDFKVKMPKHIRTKMERLVDAGITFFQMQLEMMLTGNPTALNSLLGASSRARPVPIMSRLTRELTEEEQKQEKEETEMIKKFLENIEPEIEQQTIAMVKEQVHTLLMMGGNRSRIVSLLKAGKIPKLIRKKEGPRGRDPLYFQWGDGVTEPIEEMYLIG